MTPTVSTPAALATLAKANPGIFAAMYARAPKAITFQGKNYVRDAASSVESKLWYLAAVARTQPSALQAIQRGSYSLDEIYGLDPDRSEIDTAEAELRAAELARDRAGARVASLKRQVKDFEDRVRDAQKRYEECSKRPVEATDVLLAIGTLGAGNLARTAGCQAYEKGQIQLWRDRIQAVKTGAMVGMAGQEGFAVPVNDGIVQNEAKVREANAEVTAAKSRLNSAKRAYDAAARRQRAEEQRAALEEARARNAEAAEQARLEAELRAQEAAAQSVADGYAQTEAETGWYGNATDPGAYVYGDDYYATEEAGYYEEESGDDYSSWWAEEFDAGMALYGTEERARAHAVDATGFDPDEMALRSYVSPWSFDAYYADAACECGSACDECGDRADQLRASYLANGWGFDDEAAAYYADKITEEGDQGFSGIGAGSAATPFDFGAVIPLILQAVLTIAPLLISTFMPPPAVHEAGPVPPSVTRDVAELTPPPMVSAPPAMDTERALLIGGGLFLLYKLVS